MTRVVDTAPFPIPLDGLFRQWHKEKSLRGRLRSAIALAVEVETGERVLVNSIVDGAIADALDIVFGAASGASKRSLRAT